MSNVTWVKRESRNRRTNGADCITFLANAVGIYRRLVQQNDVVGELVVAQQRDASAGRISAMTAATPHCSVTRRRYSNATVPLLLYAAVTLSPGQC